MRQARRDGELFCAQVTLLVSFLAAAAIRRELRLLEERPSVASCQYTVKRGRHARAREG